MNIERSGRGVLFNAVHREPEAQRSSKPIIEACRSAKRMWVVLANSGLQDSFGFALFTEKEPWLFMQDSERCRAHLWPECDEFKKAQNYFTHVIFYEDLRIPPVIERRERFQTWPRLWLQRIIATLNSPFEESLVVDSDVYACTDFTHIFDDYLGAADVCITKAPAPFGSSRNYKGAFRAGFPERYANFTERNLGLQVLKTGKPQVLKLVALFRDVYIRQVNDTERVSIGNDQSAFREALFTMQDSITETSIPSNIGCRHDLGCADGCLLVHRHHKPELSGKEYEAWKKEQNRIKKEERERREREQQQQQQQQQQQ